MFVSSFVSIHTIINVGALAFSRATFGQGTGSIWLDQVACTGTEGRLADCSANPIGVHDCQHSEDAGVRCPGKLILPFPLVCSNLSPHVL